MSWWNERTGLWETSGSFSQVCFLVGLVDLGEMMRGGREGVQGNLIDLVLRQKHAYTHTHNEKQEGKNPHNFKVINSCSRKTQGYNIKSERVTLY